MPPTSSKKPTAGKQKMNSRSTAAAAAKSSSTPTTTRTATTSTKSSPRHSPYSRTSTPPHSKPTVPPPSSSTTNKFTSGRLKHQTSQLLEDLDAALPSLLSHLHSPSPITTQKSKSAGKKLPSFTATTTTGGDRQKAWEDHERDLEDALVGLSGLKA